MNRTIATLSKGIALVPAAGLVALVFFADAPAKAQVQVWVPPPAEFIASTEPVYYEGHPAYWYGGHWYWRDEHGGWGHYDHEPPFLADRRAHFPPVRRSWERWHR